MTATAHTTIERGQPIGLDPRVLASGHPLTRTLFIDWGAHGPTQTTTAIRDLMQTSQLLHAATAVSGLIGDTCESTGFHLVTLGRTMASFANSSFCKLGVGRQTSSATDFLVEVFESRNSAFPVHSLASKANPTPSSTPAARSLARIKQASELTTEALAPLVGVSRRTLHLWLAGGQISQRNEERLRALAEAIEAIAAVAPETARARLMERVPGYPRIYDLLAEGRFEAAIARGTGAVPVPRPVIYPAARPASVSVDVLVDALHDAPPSMKGQIDRRLTKRLR
jgi:hypothetical protein